MPAVSKKQQKFMQAVANSPKFAKKVGVNQSIGREFTKEKDMKTKKMNMGGRAMADRAGAQAMDPRMQMAMEAQQKRAAMGGMMKGGKVKKMKMGGPTARTKSIMNEKDEIRRVDREIREKEGYKKGGKVKGYKAGGMMADKMGRALAKDNKGMTAAQLKDAGGRAMATGGMLARTGGSSAPMKAKGKKMMGGGKVKAYKKGGKVGSASKRADGIAQRGHTRGRIV
jgi:hypothetical protein